MTAQEPLERLSLQLAHLVRTLKDLHAVATHEVEPSSVVVLARLAELGPTRLSTLAGALCLDLSTVSRQVPTLERVGWVDRHRDPDDHRAQRLELTPAGRAALEQVRHRRSALLRRLVPDWTDQELSDFADQLDRFTTDVTTHRPAVLRPGTGQETPA